MVPPAALMEDCNVSDIPHSGNNTDLLELAQSLILDLRECSQTKVGLRQWVLEMTKEH